MAPLNVMSSFSASFNMFSLSWVFSSPTKCLDVVSFRLTDFYTAFFSLPAALGNSCVTSIPSLRAEVVSFDLELEEVGCTVPGLGDPVWMGSAGETGWQARLCRTFLPLNNGERERGRDPGTRGKLRHNCCYTECLGPPQIHILKPNPQSDSLWKWGSGEVMRSWR